MEDASNEIILQTDDDGVRLKIGDCFFPVSSDDAEPHLAEVSQEGKKRRRECGQKSVCVREERVTRTGWYFQEPGLVETSQCIEV